VIAGVCDGHGPFGHEVSHFFTKHLPFNIDRCIPLTIKTKIKPDTSPSEVRVLRQSIREGFKRTEQDLKLSLPHGRLDYSGSTC
jgi:serine/threonine protein phosphatase PrpC